MDGKIKAMDEIARLAKKLKQDGKKIVHCHGCFDLLHIGHVKHFEAAKKLGDFLIVTVTPDKYVNKGPGRPYFNEQLRMDALAALESVDYVALNKWATAVEPIMLIQPDYFVKGSDYKDMSSDSTGNIYKEKNAVESCGGQLSFTNEISFSSTAIINRFYDVFTENTRYYLSKLKEKYEPSDILLNLDKIKDVKVLVVGETIIDEYVYCKPKGRVEKAPIISTVYDYEEKFAGGSMAIARHLAQFSDTVGLLTKFNQTDVEWIKKEIPTARLNSVMNNRIPTIRKRRYIVKTPTSIQKMMEMAYLEDTPDIEDEKLLIQTFNEIIGNYDMVIVSDFGHGMVTEKLRETILNCGKFIAVNAQTNSTNFGYNYVTRYNKPNYISIDENELRLPFQDRYGPIQTLVEKLVNATGCGKVNITLGGEGAIYFDGKMHNYVPALAGKIVDTVGAGDAVLAITSLLVYKKCPSDLIPFIGNCAGGIAVTIIGNKEPVTNEKLKSYVKVLLK